MDAPSSRALALAVAPRSVQAAPLTSEPPAPSRNVRPGKVVLIATAAPRALDARMCQEAAQSLRYARAGLARLVDLWTLKLGPAQERKPAKNKSARGSHPSPADRVCLLPEKG